MTIDQFLPPYTTTEGLEVPEQRVPRVVDIAWLIDFL